MLNSRLSAAQTVALALACLLALALIAIPADGAKTIGGAPHWTLSSDQPIQCTSTGRICAEWIVEGHIQWICCLEPHQLREGLEVCPNPIRPQI